MQTKQVIIFRKDLLKGENSIRKGKFGAQCAHASLCAFLSSFEQNSSNPLGSDKQLFKLQYEESTDTNFYRRQTQVWRYPNSISRMQIFVRRLIL